MSKVFIFLCMTPAPGSLLLVGVIIVSGNKFFVENLFGLCSNRLSPGRCGCEKCVVVGCDNTVV